MAFPPIGPNFGALVRQAASGKFWQLLSSLVGNDSLVPGNTVTDALNNLITPPAPPDYSTQAEWYVSPLTGSDGNDGLTPATALETTNEITRRTGTDPMPQNVTITILDSVPSSNFLSLRRLLQSSSRITVTGVPVLLQQVVLTGVQNFVLMVTRPSVTVAGFDWTPFVGKRCRKLSNNVVFWVEGVASGDVTTALISRPYLTTGVNLSVGDTIAIEDLPALGGAAFDCSIDGSNRSASLWLLFSHLRLDNRLLAAQLTYQAQTNAGGASDGTVNARFDYCDIDVRRLSLDIATMRACKFAASGDTRIMGARVEPFNCSFQGHVHVDRGLCFVQSDTSSTNRLSCSSNGNKRATLFANRYSAWGWPGQAINGDTGAILSLGQIWGTSAVAGSYALALTYGVRSAMDPANFILAGAETFDVRIGGLNLPYSQLPFINPLNGASAVFGAA